MSLASALPIGKHALLSDGDIPPEKLMTARARAALAWGHLQGLLAHAPPAVASLFAYGLVRASLVDALQKSGFGGADLSLSLWFCGLDPLPADTPQVETAPFHVADGLLIELSLSTWRPLSEAASVLRRVARYGRAGAGNAVCPSQPALAQAKKIASRSNILIGKKWPLAVLDHIHNTASKSPAFAPFERGSITIGGPMGLTVVEHATSKSPLWALDIFAGQAIAAHISGTVPLPCPGLYRSEALKPELRPNERGALIADAVGEAVVVMIRRLEDAHANERILSAALSSRRSTSRAPSLALILAGFGALRPLQLSAAFNLSKNGVRQVIHTVVDAGIAETKSYRGQSLVYCSASYRRMMLSGHPAAHSSSSSFS